MPSSSRVNTKATERAILDEYHQLKAELDALRAHVFAVRTEQTAAHTGYLRGDPEASAYLGFRDQQGRTFRRWADRNQVPYSVIGSTRVYRRADIDRVWLATAHNVSPRFRPAA